MSIAARGDVERALDAAGFDPDVSFAAASAISTSLAANGWRRAAATVGV